MTNSYNDFPDPAAALDQLLATVENNTTSLSGIRVIIDDIERPLFAGIFSYTRLIHVWIHPQIPHTPEPLQFIYRSLMATGELLPQVLTSTIPI